MPMTSRAFSSTENRASSSSSTSSSFVLEEFLFVCAFYNCMFIFIKNELSLSLVLFIVLLPIGRKAWHRWRTILTLQSTARPFGETLFEENLILDYT